MNIRVMIRIFQIICTLIWMSKCQNLFSNYIFDYQMERTANRPKHLTKGRSVWFFSFPFRFIPSIGSTSLSYSDSSQSGFFKESSEWEGIASATALLNAPLHKQSCSDTGKRIPKSQAPVNSSTFHRNKLLKARMNSKMVVHTTSCCHFGNFLRRKHSWRTCFL